jgi:hypothetical protein
VIFGNIKDRAHFVVLLTPSCLDRANEPASRIPRDISDQLDGSIELRDDILAVLRDLDECPPAA